MIYINRPFPKELPKRTTIYIAENNKDIIVQTPETNPEKLQKEVEQFIKAELEKAKKQQQKYNTIVRALEETIAE